MLRESPRRELCTRGLAEILWGLLLSKNTLVSDGLPACLGREALMMTLYASLRFYTATCNPSFLRSLSNIGKCGTTRRLGLLNPLASNDWTIFGFKRLRET